MPKASQVEGKVRSRLSAKVSLLEQWARGGTAPEGTEIPQGPAALARWSDSTLGLESWTSPNIAAPNGPNADLRLRYDAALSILTADRNKSLNDKKRIGHASKIDGSLVEQIITLSEALQVSEAALRRSQHLLRLERERTAALVASSSKITVLNRG